MRIFTRELRPRERPPSKPAAVQVFADVPDVPAIIPAPTFSVIMPSYNMGNRGLERAIESVISQTLADWELIIVDDGSTDGSGRIMDWYAARDPRIRVHHQENRGLPAARNAGHWLSRGEYVAYLDADDEYLPDKLERQFAVLKAHPEMGALFGQFIADDGRIGFNYDDTPDDPWEAVLTRNCVPCQSVVLRRSLLQAVGGNDVHTPCLRSTGQDWDQWLRAFAVTDVGRMTSPVYKLHSGADRISTVLQGTAVRQEMLDTMRERAGVLDAARKRLHARRTRVLLVCQDAWARGAQQMTLSLLRHMPADVEAILTLRGMHGELLSTYQELLPVEALTPELCEWADIIHYHHHGWMPAVDLSTYADKLLVTRHSLVRTYDESYGRVTRCWNEALPAEPTEEYAPVIEITNPVDFGAGTNVTLDLSQGPLILGLFPFQKLKGVDLWLDTAERIHSERPDCAFIIAGPRESIDKEYSRYSLRVKRMSERGVNISFLPPQDRATVRALCSRASVLMHLSHTEAMPLAILEAQAEGTPVVCTAAGGMPQALYHGAVVSRDASAAARAAIRFLDERLPESIVERISWRHDPRRVSASYSEVYRHIRLQNILKGVRE